MSTSGPLGEKAFSGSAPQSGTCSIVGRVQGLVTAEPQVVKYVFLDQSTALTRGPAWRKGYWPCALVGSLQDVDKQ